MNFEAIREEFPALGERTFLDAACVSITPRRSATAIEQFLRRALTCPEASATLNHIAMDDERAAARPLVGRLVNAREDEIALVESTSHALAIAAQAVPLAAGDQVLIGAPEFMEVAVPWCQLRDHIGIELGVVPHREGRHNSYLTNRAAKRGNELQVKTLRALHKGKQHLLQCGRHHCGESQEHRDEMMPGKNRPHARANQGCRSSGQDLGCDNPPGNLRGQRMVTCALLFRNVLGNRIREPQG